MVIALALFSCSSDDFDQEVNSDEQQGIILGKKTKQTFSFRLSEAGGVPSRADNEPDNSHSFVDGNEEERAINNLLIILYDKNGVYRAHFDSADLTSSTDNSEQPSIEKIKWNETFTVEVDVYEDLFSNSDANKNIAALFAVVNYDDNILKLLETSVTDSEGKTVKIMKGTETLKNIKLTNYQTTISGKKGFVMTTPGHYKSDKTFIHYWEVEPASQGNEIARQQVFDVYVERIAARIDVNIKDDVEGIDVLYGTDVFSLVFNPGTFGLEAQESESYFTKHQSVATSSFTAANGYHAGDFYDWINYEGKRTFWAESPTFTSTKSYPAKGDGTETDLALNYLTFNQLNNQLSEKQISGETFKSGNAYILEHTFAISEANSNRARNPYAVPTSMVLKGYYTVKYKTTDEVEAGDRLQHPEDRRDDASGVDTNSPANSGVDTLNLNGAGFYLRHIDMERTDKDVSDSKRYRYRLYRENNGATTVSTDVNKINYDKQKDDLFNAFLKEQLVVFTRTVETYTYNDETGATHTEITETYNPVRASTLYTYTESGTEKRDYLADKIFEIKNTQVRWLDNNNSITSSNTYTLQLKSGAIPSGVTLYYAIYPDPSKPTQSVAKYEPITSIDNMNVMLQKQLGYAQKFYKGNTFFYAPILHYTGTGKPFSNTYTGLFNYKKNTDGSFEIASGNYVLDHLTGDFGVVRNHIYDFTIGGISSLGYGIPSNDHIPLPEPIAEHDIYQFDIVLKILPWNVFEYTLDI